MKYVKIYQRSFEEKDLRIRVSGESRGEVVGNPAAIGVIPHTFLDNALKYAPRGTQVEIRFVETDSALTFSVGSYGPGLGHGEEKKIFDLFYRGVEAKRVEPEGSGFGLHLAQLIAIKYDTLIQVAQDPTNRRAGCCWTQFTVEFSRRRP